MRASNTAGLAVKRHRIGLTAAMSQVGNSKVNLCPEQDNLSEQSNVSKFGFRSFGPPNLTSLQKISLNIGIFTCEATVTVQPLLALRQILLRRRIHFNKLAMDGETVGGDPRGAVLGGTAAPSAVHCFGYVGGQ